MTHLIKSKGITTFALVLLIAGAIDSIRNLPATALFGSSLIFFFVLAAVMLLLPAALVSAELASTYTEKSGVYAWVQKAFGDKLAFFAIWLQWINTMVWYPTILSFIAGILAFIIDPKLANNKLYLVTVILVAFWGLTFINLKGLKVSARFNGICVIIGLIIPMLLIMGLFAVWLIMHKPLQIHFTYHELLPNLSHGQSWISLTAIMTSFLGMELATVHVKNVHNPAKTFPKALFISVIIILITMLVGSLAIAMVIPHNQIQLVSGVMEAFGHFFAAYHLSWVIPIVAVLLLVGSLGEMVNWIISPAKGLLQAGQTGYLPKFFLKENQHGVASNLLLTQAVLVSVVCLVFLLMPSVNGSYWLLTDLSTQLYLVMYVLMFLAAIGLKLKNPFAKAGFLIPGGRVGMTLVCLLGIVGCGITIVVGFFPPAGINVGGFAHYERLFVTGMVLMCAPALLFYGYKFFRSR